MTLAGVAVDPGRARDVARDILSQEPFTPRRLPRPFAGVLRWLGEEIVDPIQRFLTRLRDALPDAGSLPWFALAAAVIVLAVVVAMRLVRDRGRERPGGRRGTWDADEPTDPGELEARAEQAERQGRLDEALRLRFRAGLVRLDLMGALELRPGLTNRAVARTLHSPRFDGLAVDFDEVVYGGRPATADDVGEARAAWPLVLREARSQ